MKKMKRIALFALTLAAAIMAFSCGGEDEPESGTSSGEIDFSSHSSYSIRVRNNSGQRLIAFKGELSADRLIGGVPTGGPTGLSRDLFGVNSEAFALILITEKQYNDNKSYLKALDNTPFTRIFAFYNAAGSNESIFDISDRLGGNCQIQIQNMTSLDVELRLNGIYGETLGYARSNMLNTTLYVNSGDYLIFPVFVKYNSIKNEIYTVYPKATNGNPWYIQQGVGGSNPYTISCDVASALTETTYSTGTAWLIIENQATDTGVQLQRGGVVQLTPLGNSTINNGFSRTFQIDMAKVPGTNKYAESTNISGYSVGRTGSMVNIGNYDLKVDTIYKVTVTGSANGGTLTVSAPAEQGTVDLSDFSDY